MIAGMDAFISKPIQIEELLNVIDSFSINEYSINNQLPGGFVVSEDGEVIFLYDTVSENTAI